MLGVGPSSQRVLEAWRFWPDCFEVFFQEFLLTFGNGFKTDAQCRSFIQYASVDVNDSGQHLNWNAVDREAQMDEFVTKETEVCLQSCALLTEID